MRYSSNWQYFSNATTVLEDADTHRSDLRCRVKAQTIHRQSHVNAGTVPETKNAGMQGRPVAGFMVTTSKQQAKKFKNNY